MIRISALCCTAAIFLLTACGTAGDSAEEPPLVYTEQQTAAPNTLTDTDEEKVGVAMPTRTSPRWIQDGGNIKRILEQKGYEVVLQYADNDILKQISQIDTMIDEGCNVLVIASIDGESLTNVLQKAQQNNIKVIAYDRLIRDSDSVKYYASFDNFVVGVLQAESLLKGLGFFDDEEQTFNIEIFGGSHDDNNAYYFYDGAMSILMPYIDEGRLIIKSNQTGMDKVSTLRWDGAAARVRMEQILSTYYDEDILHGVLSPYDGISLGVLEAAKKAGYGSREKKLPVVTGQDAELDSIKSIIAEEQYSTIFKDTRTLAKKAAEMVDAIFRDEEADVNDVITYDNGVKIVPSYLCKPITVYIENYKEVLIDSGYYSEDELL